MHVLMSLQHTPAIPLAWPGRKEGKRRQEDEKVCSGDRSLYSDLMFGECMDDTCNSQVSNCMHACVPLVPL